MNVDNKKMKRVSNIKRQIIKHMLRLDKKQDIEDIRKETYEEPRLQIIKREDYQDPVHGILNINESIYNEISNKKKKPIMWQ